MGKSGRWMLLLALLLVAPAWGEDGLLLREATSGVGVFHAQVAPGNEWEKGDIVRVERDGVGLGEATVMQVDADGRVLVTLRGDLEARPGDRLSFLRRPARVHASSHPSAPAEPASARVQSGNPPWARAEPTSAPLVAYGGPLCWLCSQPSPNIVYLQGVKMDVCRPCMEVPVFNPHLVDTLYRKVRECLEEEWGFVVRPSPNLDVATLQRGLLGYYDGWEMTIGAYQRLPFLMGVIAHEYAHAWHVKINPGLRDKLVVEGFATWVEYKFLRDLGQPALAEQMLENAPATPYVAGFRVMQQVEAKYGASGVFSAVAEYGEED